MGRDPEFAAFDAVLDRVHAGTGRLVEITGEVGIGKSRLLKAFRERADDLELHHLTCELHRASTPYGASRKLFRGLVGIAPDAAPQAAGRQLLSLLEQELPDLVAWAPLLAIAFGAELPATDATADLDQQYVRPRLNDTVAQLLAWRWPTPVLLTVEDVQWMDEASADILRSLAGQLDRRPWVVCVTRRDAADGEEAHAALALPLGPLDGDSMRELANAASADAPLPAHEMAALVERSGGNPLFLEELMAATREAGGIDQLPDSIEALTIARIDRLPHRERSVLSHVSVLGQRFPADLADAVLPEVVDDEVWSRLADFLERDGDTVRFRHALTRDVAYSGLRYRLRRQLHAKAGDVIAAAAGDQLAQQAGLLAFHFFHAQRHEEAWRYSLTAAELARAVYATAEAATFLEHAVDAARGIDDLSPTALAQVHEQLGDVRDHMGVYRGAAAAYRTARRLLPPDPVDEARLILKQARQHGWLSKYSQALRWIRRGLKLIEDMDGLEAAKQRAQLSVWYAQFCEEEGRHELALRWCRRAIDEAEAADEPEALAHAYRLLDRAYANLGRIDEAIYSADALTIYEGLDDLRGQAVVTNNLAGLAYHQGDWVEMRDRLEQSLEVCQRIGDEDGVARATYNLGHLLCDQGRLVEAEELLGVALRIGQAAGHRASVAIAQRDLARVAARSGRHARAMELLDEAHAAFQDVGARVDDIDTLAVVAEAHLLQGDAERALQVVDEALELSRSLGGISAQSPLLHRTRGYALMRTRALGDARLALDESLQAGRSRAMDYEVALTLRALVELAELDHTSVGPSPADLSAESRAILDRLEVVRIPTVPGTVND